MLFPAQLPSPVVQENTTLQDQVSPGQPGASGLVSPLPQGTSISGKDRALAQVQSQLAEVSRDSDFCWGGIHRTAFLYLFKYPDFHNVSLSSDRNFPECAVTSLMHIIQYANFDCSYFNKSVKQINIHF